MSEHITAIADLDGMSIKDASRMPHPTLLSEWQALGLYQIDTDLGVFRVDHEAVAAHDEADELPSCVWRGAETPFCETY